MQKTNQNSTSMETINVVGSKFQVMMKQSVDAHKRCEVSEETTLVRLISFNRFFP